MPEPLDNDELMDVRRMLKQWREGPDPKPRKIMLEDLADEVSLLLTYLDRNDFEGALRQMRNVRKFLELLGMEVAK